MSDRAGKGFVTVEDKFGPEERARGWKSADVECY